MLYIYFTSLWMICFRTCLCPHNEEGLTNPLLLSIANYSKIYLKCSWNCAWIMQNFWSYMYLMLITKCTCLCVLTVPFQNVLWGNYCNLSGFLQQINTFNCNLVLYHCCWQDSFDRLSLVKGLNKVKELAITTSQDPRVKCHKKDETFTNPIKFVVPDFSNSRVILEGTCLTFARSLSLS